MTQHADLLAFHQAEASYGYCTEVLFRPQAVDLETVRERVTALGTSVLVVGDSDLMKIHVHTLRPGGALDLATELGEIVRVKVDNMRLQYKAFANAAPETEPSPGVSAVAVALGSGFQEVFASLNATVVTGGQSMNPAVADIVAAIRRAPHEHVVVLPNNRNVILTAEQAARAIAGRHVTIIPTRSMCQGIAAILALSPDGDIESNLAAMKQAADRCLTIELTHAARETEVAGEVVAEGAWIAVVDDQLVAGADHIVALLGRVLDRLPARPYELATIYLGIGSTDAESEAIRDLIATRMGIEVERVQGGQPHYPYIISLE
jgi:dihydroxyacetone kinase-like predicted kinase